MGWQALEKRASIFNIRFSELEIGVRIGSGAFSTVFRGKYHSNDVAVKRQPLKSGDEIQEKYLMSELEILTVVSHENLIKFHGAALNDGYVYIVTDYLPSGDLHNILKSDVALSWQRRLNICLGIAKVGRRRCRVRSVCVSVCACDDARGRVVWWWRNLSSASLVATTLVWDRAWHICTTSASCIETSKQKMFWYGVHWSAAWRASRAVEFGTAMGGYGPWLTFCTACLRSRGQVEEHSWKAVLCDYGVAKRVPDGASRKQTICGTQSYMAPEVIFDEVQLLFFFFPRGHVAVISPAPCCS